MGSILFIIRIKAIPVAIYSIFKWFLKRRQAYLKA
jgi:hypothetical protein